MATRESRLRVLLDPGAFKRGLSGMVGATRSAGRRMGSALEQPMKAGLNSARDSIKGMAGEVGGLIKQAGTLGGAISIGAGVTQAVRAEEAYIRLGSAISQFAGRSVSAAEAQALVEQATDKTKGSLDDARDALGRLAGVGDLDTIEESLERVELQSRRLGVESSQLAEVYSRLLSKGIADSAAEAEGLVEKMNRFGRATLGLNVEESLDPNDLAEFASFVNASGSSVEQLTALLGKTGDTAKDLGQSLEIIEELGLVLNSRKGLDELRKAAGLSKDEVNQSKGAVENLFTTLEKGGTKGFDVLQQLFGTDRARRALEQLVGEDILVGLDTGEASEQDFQTRIQRLREGLQSDFEDKAKEAAERRKRIEEKNAEITDSSAANFRDALNRLDKAFQQPEMMKAIDELADSLPELAKMLAGVVSFAANNPLLAGASVVGGRAGLSLAGGALSSGASAAASGLGGLIKTSLVKRKVGRAIQQGLGSLNYDPAARKLAQSTARQAAWSSAGTSVASTAAGGARWARVGKGLGAAAAATIGVALAANQNQKLKSETEGLGALDIVGGMISQGTFDPMKVVEKHQNKLAKQRAEKRREIEKVAGGGSKDATPPALPPAPQQSTTRASEDAERLAKRMTELADVGTEGKQATRENTAGLAMVADELRRFRVAGPNGGGASRGPNAPGTPPTGGSPREG